MKEISAGTFFYVTLLLTEGIGLLLRKKWAEYFTIAMTNSFIPFEVYELIKRFTFAKVCVIAINVAAVWYLAAKVIRERSHPQRS